MVQQYEPSRGARYFTTLLWCALALMAYMPLHGFVATWGGTAIGPLLLWKSIPEICIGLLVAAYLIGVAFYRISLESVVSSRVLQLALTWAAIAGAVTLWRAPLDAAQTMAGIAFDLRYIVLFVVVTAVACSVPSLQWRHIAGRAVAVMAVFLGVVGLLQVTVLPADFLTHFGYGASTIAPVSTIDQNPDVRRAFATTRGPNDYGALLLIPLAAAMCGVWRRKISWAVGAVAAIGIGISGSRSAWVGGLVVIAAGTLLTQSRVVRLLRRPIVVAAGLAVAAVVAIAAVTVPVVRLAIFHSSPTDSHLTEGSTDNHWAAVIDGVRRVLADPIGCGMGCAGPASFYGDNPRISESYYVQIAQETGILGLIVWGALYWSVLVALYQAPRRGDAWVRVLFVSGLGIVPIGLLLHVWADSALGLVWWGLAALVIATPVVKPRKKGYDSTKI